MATGGFIPSYASSPAVGHERTDVLVAVTYGAGVWFVFTYLAGYLSDKIGRKNTYFLGFGAQLLACFPLFWLINTGSLPMLYLAMTIFSVGLGLAYGPQAALYSEMFPASVRFSGVSISYALGAILGGAFAPTIATALVQATGGTEAVSLYLVGMTLISLVAVCLVRDRSGLDLSIRHQAEQEVGALVFDRRIAAVPNETTQVN
jgi:MFS family permease